MAREKSTKRKQRNSDSESENAATKKSKSDTNLELNTLPDIHYEPIPDNQIKICSWNVNSLKAALKKGFKTYVDAEDPTILCLQETKCNAEVDLFSKSRYPFQYWLCAKNRKGYSGSAVFSKIEPIAVTFGINEPEFEEEGRVITLEFDGWYLVASYIINAGQKLERLEYKSRYMIAFEKYLRTLESKKSIIWTGDLNVAHKEIDLARPKTNKKTAGFTMEERRDFERIIEAEPKLIDTWRYLHPDVQDVYTYFSYRFHCRSKNIGWRLDYFVMSGALLPLLVDSIIRNEAYGASDHVPIVLIIKKTTLQYYVVKRTFSDA